MMVLETHTTDIVIEFKNHEVRPEQINIRYACSHENKAIFSYIDTVLGSHDGTTWTALEQVDMTTMRNFLKSNVFKFPIVLSSSSPTFYKYICLRSNASKDLTHKNNLHKMFNRTHIPISGIELYGHYTSPSNTNILGRLDTQLHQFVKSFLQFKNIDQTRNVELDYILNMFLESYKELNTLITTSKIKQALLLNQVPAAAATSPPLLQAVSAAESSVVDVVDFVLDEITEPAVETATDTTDTAVETVAETAADTAVETAAETAVETAADTVADTAVETATDTTEAAAEAARNNKKPKMLDLFDMSQTQNNIKRKNKKSSATNTLGN
jgi:hypothetical protein